MRKTTAATPRAVRARQKAWPIADSDRAWPRLFVRRDAGRADPSSEGIVNICTACTAPALTASTRKRNMPVSPAPFQRQRAGRGRRHLRAQRRQGAIGGYYHDGSQYRQRLREFADNFKQMGKRYAQEAISPNDVDMHPLLTHRQREARPDCSRSPPPPHRSCARRKIRQAWRRPPDGWGRCCRPTSSKPPAHRLSVSGWLSQCLA